MAIIFLYGFIIAAACFLRLIKRKLRETFYLRATTLIFSVFPVLFSLNVAAQQEDTARSPHADTSKKDFVSMAKQLAEREAGNSIEKFKTGRIAMRQDDVFENIKRITYKAKTYLKSGIDTSGITAEMKKIENWYAIAGDGVFTNKGTAQTHRNLSASSKILKELLTRAMARKIQVDRYEKDLVNFRNALDSLVSDSTLYIFPSDSAVLVQYLQRLSGVAKEINPTDSTLEQALTNVKKLQTPINLLVNMLNSSLEEIEDYRQGLSDKAFDREFANLWGPVGNRRPFGQIISFSGAKGKLSFLFYFRNNLGKFFLLFLLITASAFFLRSLKHKVVKEGIWQKDFTGQLILRYPVLSAIMIVLNLFQFIFPAPPFIVNCLLWILSAVCLTIIFRSFITRYWMFVWLTLFVLFVIACVDNLVLQASRTERWGMFFLASAGVVAGSFILVRGHRSELREKAILYFIGFVVFIEAASIITNLYGRYNLSKTLLTSGFFNVIIAIMFLWTVRLINEGLSLASRVYRRPEGKLFYINFDRVGRKAPTVFYVFLVIGWFILFGRNFYAFRFIEQPFKNFLFAERTIGSYSVSISSVLGFFLIMTLSVIISRIVSFFASDSEPGQSSSSKEKKAGLGSWLLLIRITIMTMGLILAFAATGMPIDRITIILGALSVGIGFGLQTLVNNLVSGLIIAFEKPVNVGDIVEIGGKAGMMKSIGFRSSILSTWEGSSIVIPNGDLLNEHLINWTQGNSRVRGEIVLGVAYGTELDKVRQILSDLLSSQEKVIKDPAPRIFFKEFNSSSIDIQIFFWVPHPKEILPVKSDIVSAIDVAFKENNITIPFPQQDLHIFNDNSEKDNERRNAED